MFNLAQQVGGIPAEFLGSESSTAEGGATPRSGPIHTLFMAYGQVVSVTLRRKEGESSLTAAITFVDCRGLTWVPHAVTTC